MTSDEPTYPGEEGESVEEVLGPDSLRAAIAKRWLEGSLRDTLAAHADAWDAERKMARRAAIEGLQMCGCSCISPDAICVFHAILASQPEEKP